MRLILASMVLLAAVLAGCQFKGDARSPRDAGGPWPFRPAAVRVHPFTRLEHQGGLDMLEARIELLDAAGDVTKGVGTLRFELYSEAPTEGRQGQGRRLYHWQVSIESLDSNAEHWDPITRTYQFMLKLDRPPPAERRLRLHVQYDAATGERLTAEGSVGQARP